MEIRQASGLTAEERETVRAIWNNEYPENLQLETPEDFERYLGNLSEKTHYLVKDGDVLLGWGLTFLREDERWFAMILDRSIHGKGIGSAVLDRMKAQHSTLYGWVIDHGNDRKTDGEPYASPLEFYKKNGFSVEADVRLELPTISAVRVLHHIDT
jgi:GNAT superfamily N-acetyltransferase